MSRALVLATLLCACGARTELSLGDAGPPFATFPCRWSYGEPLELGVSSGPISEVSGAAHGTREQAAIVAQVLGGSIGGVSTLSLSPRRLAGDPPGPGRALSGSDGYLLVSERACRVLIVDSELSPRGPLFDDPSPCAASQTAVDRAEVFLLESGQGLSLSSIRGERREPLFLRAARYDGAEIVRLGPGRGFALLRSGARASLARFGPEGEEAIDIEPVGDASIAQDRLRGGVVLLREEGDGTLTFERYEAEGFLGAEVLMTRIAAPGRPLGPVVTNETEALVPLSGGVVAYLPLAATAPRYVEPLPEPDISRMHVFLRPGSSAGGVAYVHRDARGEHLVFRALVCNR
ncbi:MAG: hypothetical protein IT378_25925 [Sandaracinaceae bacterium]|nr:hypothetical protein [Sandaracinaceae bacterium]